MREIVDCCQALALGAGTCSLFNPRAIERCSMPLA
jgi:hypothetical protein